MTGFVRVVTPCYRGDVKARYAHTLAQMTQDLLLASSPMRLHSIEACPDHLITARNVLLSQSLDLEEVNVVLWLDGDCAPVYQDPIVLYRFLKQATTPGVAMVAAACARRSGRAGVVGSNVVPLREEDTPREKWSPYEVSAVGLGICAWNLWWWRSALREEPRPLHFFEWRDGVTEDHRACAWAREHGGQILIDPALGSWHDGAIIEPQVGRIARPS